MIAADYILNHKHKEQLWRAESSLNIRKKILQAQDSKAAMPKLEKWLLNRIIMSSHKWVIKAARGFQLNVNLLGIFNSIVHRHQTVDTKQDADMYKRTWNLVECALKKLELQRTTQMGGEHWVEPYLI